MHQTVKRIKNKFMTCAPEFWWGDHLDVRFYLVQELKRFKNKRILDLGCGIGIILSELDNSNYKFGVDTSKKAIKKAKMLNPNANLIIGDLTKLPLKPKVIDIISAANVIPGSDFIITGKKEELQKIMIKEMTRALKDKGQMFLTTPNNAYYEKWLKNPSKISREQLKKLFKSYFNFKILEWNPFPPWPWFLPGRILAKIPGIFILLKKIKFRKGKYLFVYGEKM